MSDERRMDEAAAWLAGQERDDFDWDGFTDWLEVDPKNRSAYDELAVIDAALDQHAGDLAPEFREAAPANDNRRRWQVGGGLALVAASAAALLLIPNGLTSPPVQAPFQQHFATAADETRTVALSDGITATLAPASLLTVQGNSLDITGEAYFDVDHRPARTLLVTAGPLRVSDIGTTFTASARSGEAAVAVESGAVSVTAGADRPIGLHAGQRATVRDSSLIIDSIAAQAVGDWRDHALTFSGAPLSLVVRTVNLYSAQKIAVDPAVANRQFSGVVNIGKGSTPATTIAAIMGLRARPDGARVVLAARR